MEARRKARSMKRSASMGRGASRSAARGKAKARAMGRAKRGGEDKMGEKYDIEKAYKEQQRQDLSDMEEGQSPNPQTVVPRTVSPSNMERGFGTQKKGGKRRGSKKFYKGKPSKTRKGRKDFVTHKGDKYFNRKGHRQTKRQGKSKSLFDQLFGL